MLQVSPIILFIYSTIMLSKLSHYAFKCTTMLNYAYQIIFLHYSTLSIQSESLSLIQSPDHQIHHSLTPYH